MADGVRDVTTEIRATEAALNPGAFGQRGQET
jgi:hypothetical protein